LIPVQANLALGGKNCELETNVAIRVMSIKEQKGAREKGALQTTQDLNVLGKILVILYFTV
jgi:hypothetical protein